jgi:hypothetical protein
MTLALGDGNEIRDVRFRFAEVRLSPPGNSRPLDGVQEPALMNI